MKLDKLSVLIEDNKEEEVKDMLNSLIPSYKSNSEIIDHIYKEKLDLNNLVKSSKIINDQENKVIKIKT